MNLNNDEKLCDNRDWNDLVVILNDAQQSWRPYTQYSQIEWMALKVIQCCFRRTEPRSPTSMDLSLVETVELIKTLDERFDHFIISGLQVGHAGEIQLNIRHYKGNRATCSGLASQISQICNTDAFEGKEPRETHEI